MLELNLGEFSRGTRVSGEGKRHSMQKERQGLTEVKRPVCLGESGSCVWLEPAGREQEVEGLCAALEGHGRVSSLRWAGQEICVFERKLEQLCRGWAGGGNQPSPCCNGGR